MPHSSQMVSPGSIGAPQKVHLPVKGGRSKAFALGSAFSCAFSRVLAPCVMVN